VPVTALQHVRRMRGGANAHLLRADDGCYYIVKFRNNPQHERILVNELICYVLLHYLRLPAPAWNLVEVRPELIDATPEMTMEAGREQRRCEAGLHFGSCFPGDPARRAVYDYVPASLLRMVLNVDCFRGMLAFDKWVSNADGRQAIFFRDRAKDWLAPGGDPRVSPRSLVYVASMIDHGFAFNAQNWDFVDSAEVGLYTRREVYEEVHGEESFQPWLDRILQCPAEVFDDAYKRVPPEWFGGDWDRLEALLERLYRRRGLVPELLRSAKQAGRDPFPQWTPGLRSTSVGRLGEGRL
jgi:hypothetical protein